MKKKTAEQPKRYFRITDDLCIPFKSMHSVRSGTVLEYVRHEPEIRSVLLRKEIGFVSMRECSVEEVEAPDGVLQ